MIDYHMLADLIVVAHLAYVGLVLLGMVTILLGIWKDWLWVRNFWFRSLHLTMIAIVVAESLWGITCPLTIWEHRLRQLGGDAHDRGSFLGHWAHELLFFTSPPFAFTTSYCLFGAVVLITFVWAPPRWPQFKKGNASRQSLLAQSKRSNSSTNVSK